MRRSRRNRRSFSKEKFFMVASSVLVMGSLTATGLWLGTDRGSKDEGYVVDLSAIENSTATGFAQEGDMQFADNMKRETSLSDDLDYDPFFQETNSKNVENPDQSGSESMSDGSEENAAKAKDTDATNKKKAGEDEAESNEGAEAAEADTLALSTAMQPALTFSDSDTLVWPVVGNILVNYSMDKTVYFATLQQYKYNPAIIIQANEGDLITAASSGKVISVFTDPQIGNAVTMELGSGYEVTYGQLSGIIVSEGSYVSAGDIIAQVAAPTKYYSVEGTNIYFKLTKNGEPLNPLSKLG